MSMATLIKFLLKNSPASLSGNVFFFNNLQGPHQEAYASRNMNLFCFLASSKALLQSDSMNCIPCPATLLLLPLLPALFLVGMNANTRIAAITNMPDIKIFFRIFFYY